MKKLLLTGVAALFLATGTAHADDKLPEHWLGRWCSAPFVSTEAQVVYFRSTCGDMTDGIMLKENSYIDEAPADDAPSCTFDKIKRKDEETYLVYLHCITQDKGEPSFEGQEEFQLVNGILFKKRMPEG